MGKIITVTSASLLLFNSAVATAADNTAPKSNSQTVVISGTAAGGHESVESLKAEIADLQTKLKNTDDGRNYLLRQLKETLARENDTKARLAELEAAEAASAAENTELQKSLSFMTDSRDYLYEELTAANAATGEANAANVDLRKQAASDKAFLHSRIQKIASQRDAASDAGDTRASQLEKQLESSQTGRDYLADRLQTVIDTSSAENAKLKTELASATAGRDYLADRLSTTLERSSAKTAALEQEIDDIASVAFAQIDSAIKQRDEARAATKDAEKEIEEIAAVSFTQINSAIAERDSALAAASDTSWADNLSADLTQAFGGLEGTEVTARNDNSVSIKVGNTGLFRLGGTNLSDAGKSVLDSIGTRLIEQTDSNINVVGHTDNVPVGTASRFSNNAELSLARASSALKHLTEVGVSPERMSASGVGDIYPIASNDTEAGQRSNRRVEIVLSPAN